MTCNKIKGIRCGLIHDNYTGVIAKKKLNCNVIAMGERIVGSEVALFAINAFLNSQFEASKENL